VSLPTAKLIVSGHKYHYTYRIATHILKYLSCYDSNNVTPMVSRLNYDTMDHIVTHVSWCT